MATGIAQSTIADWKRKKTNPAADKIMLICDVLNISPYELLQDSKRLNGGYGWLLTTVPTGEAHWVVIKTDKDNLEIIEIIMRKKAEDHIETCL